MNKDRLQRLITLLRSDAENSGGVKFDLNYWGRTYGPEGKGKIRDRTVPASCGTVACAAGLAAISGTFKAEGLSYAYSWAGSAVEDHGLYPTYEGDAGYTAIMKFFDLKKIEAYYLFSPLTYPADMRAGAAAERYVAGRIQDFIDDKVDEYWFKQAVSITI